MEEKNEKDRQSKRKRWTDRGKERERQTEKKKNTWVDRGKQSKNR
jgi:hypothetical protein